MPYQKKDKTGGRLRREWYVAIPTRNGGRIQRSAKTDNERTAKNYETMFHILGPRDRREFDLIQLVIDRKVEIAELYQEYKDGKLDELRKRFAEPAPQEKEKDPDLEPHVERWKRARTGRLAPTTRDNYHSAVRLLIPKGQPFPRSQFTKARLSTWIGEMEDVSSAAVHYRWSGLRNYISFLLEQGILDENPADGVKRPKLPDPRYLHLEPVDALRLANEMGSPDREISILINGTGADLTPAIGIRCRDVDVAHREIFVRGTKRTPRERYVRVAEWAWPHIERLLEGKGPGDPLFDPAIVNRFDHWRAHTAAVKRLVAAGHTVFEGYTPRDSRHTFAVRLVRAGVPLEVVGQQLGHKDATMVSKVYGRFRPRQDERNRWELAAAALD